MVKGLGLFFYTTSMLIMVLYNVCTPLDIVNRVKGIATGIILYNKSKFTNP
jgi:hypothetical protein